jgi:hypothetical protein
VSSSTELHSLDDLGITQFDLGAASTTQWDNGNIVGLTSNYQTTDGAVHEIADVWFAVDNTLSGTSSPVDQSSSVDLSGRVTELAQAISSFDSALQPGNAAQNAPTLPVVTQATVTATLSATVSGMADVLRQFDSQGMPLTPGATISAASSLESALKKPDENAILTSGK